MFKKRKAQISLFLVLGIIILIIFSVFFYLSFTPQIPEEGVVIKLESSVELKEYVSSCLRDVVNNNVNRYGVKEEVLKNAINIDIKRCVNDFFSFKRQGYEVNYGNPIADVHITDTTITTYLNYPIELEKENYLFREENFIYILDRKSNIRLPVDSNGVTLRAVTITSPDGRAELIIPSGTRVTKPDLAISINDNTYNSQKFGLMSSIIYQFEPSGMSFSPPAILRISYEDSWFPKDFDESKLKVVYFDSNEERFISLPSDIDTRNNRITATVSHFTNFTIAQCECFDLVKARSELSDKVVKTLEESQGMEGGKNTYEFSVPPGDYYLAALSSQTEHKSFVVIDSFEINGQEQEGWAGLNDEESFFFIKSFPCGEGETKADREVREHMSDVEDQKDSYEQDSVDEKTPEDEIQCETNSDCQPFLTSCDPGGYPRSACVNNICKFVCVYDECEQDEDCEEGYFCSIDEKRCILEIEEEPDEDEEEEIEEEPDEDEEEEIEEEPDEDEEEEIEEEPDEDDESLCHVKLVLSHQSPTTQIYVLDDGFSVPRACSYPIGECSIEYIDSLEPVQTFSFSELNVETANHQVCSHGSDHYYVNYRCQLKMVLDVQQSGTYCLLLEGPEGRYLVEAEQHNERAMFEIEGNPGSEHVWMDEGIQNENYNRIVIPNSYELEQGPNRAVFSPTCDGETVHLTHEYDSASPCGGSLHISKIHLAAPAGSSTTYSNINSQYFEEPNEDEDTGMHSITGHVIYQSSKTFMEQNGVVSMEAEHYTSQNGYSVVSNNEASGGKVMQVGASGNLNFDFEVNQGGTWYFWVRTYADAHDNNGLHLSLNGKRLTAPSSHSLAGTSDIYLIKGSWSWEPRWQKGEQHAGPVTIELTPGKHRLTISKRKIERPLIDKIVLTKSSQPPSGFGPSETVSSSSQLAGTQYASGHGESLPVEEQKILPIPKCIIGKEIENVCDCFGNYYENCPQEENCVCLENGADCGITFEDDDLIDRDGNIINEDRSPGYTIGVHYYPWWDVNEHWSRGYFREPYLGLYDSGSKFIAEQHIKDAVKYGVNVFAVEYYPNAWIDNKIQSGLLRADNLNRIRFAMFYDTFIRFGTGLGKNMPYDFRDPDIYNAFVSDIIGISENYFDHQYYYKIDGKPVIWIYITREFIGPFGDAVNEVRQKLNGNIYIIADHIWWNGENYKGRNLYDSMDVFDAVSSYSMLYEAKSKEPNCNTVGKFASCLEPEYMKWKQAALSKNIDFHPGIFPSYNDYHHDIDIGHTPKKIDSTSKQDFIEMLEMSKRTSTDSNIIWITSWNEWHEGTTIEPTMSPDETIPSKHCNYLENYQNLQKCPRYPNGYYYYDYLYAIKETFG